MEANGNGKRFDWRSVIVVAIVWLVTIAVQWGTTSTQITDLTRRVELLERRMDERALYREEYERRHSELTGRVDDCQKQIRELEKQVNDLHRR